jgi:hypothetical protein
MDWFQRCVQQVRSSVPGLPVRIFSDASEHDLTPLLAIGGVTLARPNPSIVDILLLAKAKALITSGTSSFSSWGAFLGAMPTAWYPGMRKGDQGYATDLAVDTDMEGNIPSFFFKPLLAAHSNTI